MVLFFLKIFNNNYTFDYSFIMIITSILTVRFQAKEMIESVYVYDMTGRLVKAHSSIKIPNLPCLDTVFLMACIWRRLDLKMDL